MVEDLCATITIYCDSGDQIILMIDLNENITSQNITDTFQQIGLREAITTKYGHTGTVPTYQRGQVPIDGIFLSPTLKISIGGYFPFHAFPTDHRFIWAKISFASCFGYRLPPFSLTRCTTAEK